MYEDAALVEDEFVIDVVAGGEAFRLVCDEQLGERKRRWCRHDTWLAADEIEPGMFFLEGSIFPEEQEVALRVWKRTEEGWLGPELIAVAYLVDEVEINSFEFQPIYEDLGGECGACEHHLEGGIDDVPLDPE